MAVESAEDLAGFFDPDEFGEQMIAQLTSGDLPVNFVGIFTTSALLDRPGSMDAMTSMAPISGVVPKIITRKGPLADLKQGDVIVRADGTEVIVNNTDLKGDLLIIHIHEVW